MSEKRHGGEGDGTGGSGGGNDGERQYRCMKSTIGGKAVAEEKGCRGGKIWGLETESGM